MKRTGIKRSTKRIGRVGPRTARWDDLRPRLDLLFQSRGFEGGCEARISPHCTGADELYAHGFKRNRDCSIGALCLVIRACRHCGLYLDKDMSPTEMLDLVLDRTKRRGWQPWFDWKDACVKWAETATYTIAVGWFDGGYEVQNADGSFEPLNSVEEAAAAAAVWNLPLRSTVRPGAT